jgi:hypothetical protein
MAYDPDRGLAILLTRTLESAAQEALLQIGEELKTRTIADIPVGDPKLDPDPNYSLKDHVVVRLYGTLVSVAVEGAYALKQHEAIHFKHPRGGHAKFLERNAVIMAVQMDGRVAGTLYRRFRDVRAGAVRDRIVETNIGAGRRP